MRMLTSSQWNKLDKPKEAQIKADYWSICAKIGNVYCYCNTKDECNFIVVYSNVSDIKNIKSIYKFMIFLYDININYITVTCKPGRYKIMQHIFHGYCADGGTIAENGYQELYFHLCPESVETLRRLSNE
jgi:hypothetical protein